MASIGVRAKVVVCKDPLLGGVGEALKWALIEEIVERYKGMIRIFILVVDRDCNKSRRRALDGLEDKAARLLADERKRFLAENAWQELEVWVLAGQTDLPKKWAWKDVLDECDPKEAYYDEYAKRRGVLQAAYEGREQLGREAASNYQRIRELCRKDVRRLEERIAAALAE